LKSLEKNFLFISTTLLTYLPPFTFSLSPLALSKSECYFLLHFRTSYLVFVVNDDQNQHIIKLNSLRGVPPLLTFCTSAILTIFLFLENVCMENFLNFILSLELLPKLG